MKRLFIVGAGRFAELARIYFEEQGHYRVEGFLVEEDHLAGYSVFGLPVKSVEDFLSETVEDDTLVFVAIGYSKVNGARKKVFQRLKEASVSFASYVSNHAVVSDYATLGDNVFILENNVVQPLSTIGDNCVLWSGNHVGHHAVIGSHSFVSSHVVISGGAHIGERVFLGANASVTDGVRVGEGSFVSSGAIVSQDVGPGQMVAPSSRNLVVPVWEGLT